jgi:hypothetical protein
MSATSLTRLALCGALFATAACAAADSVIIGTKLEGESCKQVSDCQAGLDCADGKCAPLPPLTTGPQRGDACTGDSQCAPDLVCGRQGVCTTGPLLDVGATCALSFQCKIPLICNGVTGVCGPDDGSAGTLGLGHDCVNITDCQRPFICGFDNKCDKPPFLSGANCDLSNAEMGAYRVYWEVPPDVLPEKYEFDRLPFPNDMRVKNGHVSLAGHSAPGEVLGIDVSGTYFAAVQEDAPGFALNQPIFFRFSDIVDHTTVCLDAGGVYPTLSDPALGNYCAAGGEATVYLVNIDPAAGADYGKRIPVQMNMSKDGGMYICQNWLGIAPKDGEPLKASTKYAAIVTTGVKDLRGEAPIRDQDFGKLMAGETAISAMDPLKAWITAKGIDAATIAGATVFTTADPTTVAAKIREAVGALPLPTYDANVMTCPDPRIPPPPAPPPPISPCSDGLAGLSSLRGCGAYPANYHELQGTYQNPVFQAGTRPYLRPEDGGAFVYNAQGVPQWQRDETMCFAAAIPKGAPPAGGFPVVMFGHGTGGSYRSFIDDGIAAELVAEGYAVIGIENVMHGVRSWPTSPPPTGLGGIGTLPRPLVIEADPGRIFFNLVNPRASRDNILQGAADLFYLTRLVRNVNATLPGPDGAVHFNPARVYYIGHSQGTVIVPPYLLAEADLKAAVLSGSGADLALSILNKKEPGDVSLAAAAVFADQTLGRIHPMMGIIAMLFAPTDSISYAPLWVRTHPDRGPLPLLHFSGVGDTFTPDVTQWAQMRASGMPIVGTPDVAVAGVATVASPAKNNLNGVTAGVAQFTPAADRNGHFVMYDVAAAKATLVHFFSSMGDENVAVGLSPEITR